MSIKIKTVNLDLTEAEKYLSELSLKEAIEIFKKMVKHRNAMQYGLCYVLTHVIIEVGYNKKLEDFCMYLMASHYKKHTGFIPDKTKYWWTLYETNERIEFLEKLIDHLKQQL